MPEITDRVPQKAEFKFYGVGTMVDMHTEMPEDGRRRTTVVLQSNEEVGPGREPNRVQVTFRGEAAVEAAKIETGTPVMVEGGLGGTMFTDKGGNKRAFAGVSGHKIAAAEPDELQGFVFQARGIVAHEPSYGETKGNAMAKVILERSYNGFLGPQASDIEIAGFRAPAMLMREAKPGQEIYVEGSVRGRTYMKDGQERWATDLVARDAIVLDTPQAKIGQQVEAKGAAISA